MDCTYCWEALSARLDGEEGPAVGPLMEARLQACPCCRRFTENAVKVTRLARVAAVADPPDLVEVVLAAAPRRSGAGLTVVLRWRPGRTSGVVPTLATFLTALTLLEALDLARLRSDPGRMLTYGLVLLGLLLVILLDRRRRRVLAAVPDGGRPRRR